ncbi:MAG: cytosine permease [Chroococcidiopsidaceae cyanobacterium CP_BM_ER_R8_30]|nr:cytosine permease [Chroococcidiopsidaceae cyanobacterium CP_BM_ER_R8_30]
MSYRIAEVEKTVGIEAHGIERVSPERRTHVRIFDNFTLWLSANLVISTVTLGSLAIGVFKLGFWDSVAAIAIFNLLGILPVSFFSTLGPKLGLRQMTISRFSFGWTGAKIMALLYLSIAIAGANSFAQTLEGFLLLVAYWLGPWSIILILEHFVFRHGSYNVDDWDIPSRLPVGWAASVSLIIGLFGVYLGAAQEKFVGLIAGLLNQPYGIDIGFELGIIFAGVAYLCLRQIKLQDSGR